jgi:exodeoxyribonuclease VII small subunit
MTDESYSFSTARARLEDIVTQVRKKDTSLEKSLDLLEEGVRLANACTELIDRQDWESVASAQEPAEPNAASAKVATDSGHIDVAAQDGTAVAETSETVGAAQAADAPGLGDDPSSEEEAAAKESDLSAVASDVENVPDAADDGR